MNACWCFPIRHVLFLVTARKRRWGKKDNQIRFFSLNSECDTLSPTRGAESEHKQSNNIYQQEIHLSYMPL